MAADRLAGEPVPLAQVERLREVARRDQHLGAALLERPDDRAHDQHVRRVSEVDPDPHRGSH